MSEPTRKILPNNANEAFSLYSLKSFYSMAICCTCSNNSHRNDTKIIPIQKKITKVFHSWHRLPSWTFIALHITWEECSFNCSTVSNKISWPNFHSSRIFSVIFLVKILRRWICPLDRRNASLLFLASNSQLWKYLLSSKTFRYLLCVKVNWRNHFNCFAEKQSLCDGNQSRQGW